MRTPPYYLLRSKRFLPIFIVQFLGAMNDNLYKNSFIILITFSLAEEVRIPLVLGLGIFTLPFFLFSGIAGELADRVEKQIMIQWIKLAEIIILGIGATAAFYLKSISLLYLVLFLMGTHSAFFGPLKYSILPQHLKKDELLFGNAWIEASTFAAILLGTIIGGVVILMHNGALSVSILLVIIALIGFVASLFIPPAKSKNSKLKVHINFLKGTFDVLKYIYKRPHLLRIIIGISWFWFIGATFLTVIPLFTKEILHGNQNIVTFLLVVLIMGIGIGAIGSYKILKGQLSAKFVPISGVGMSVFIVLMINSGQTLNSPIIKLYDFLSFNGLYILVSILGVSLFGGFFSVPLYALLQHWSKPEHRSRNISANNITNAMFLVGSSLTAMLIFKLGGGIYALLILTAIANFGISMYMLKIVPRVIIISQIKKCIRFVLSFLYRVKIDGLENLKNMSPRAIIIVNHVSLLDAVLLWAFFPERFVYPVDLNTAKLWWVKPILLLAKSIPLDPRHPFSLKKLISLIEKGQRIVIFPEGRITVTGSIMKIYEGTGYISMKTGATIYPIFISGAKYSFFSYLKREVKQQWFPQIRIRIFPPQKIQTRLDESVKEARKDAARQIYDLMLNMELEMSRKDLTLFEGLIIAGKLKGRGTEILSNIEEEAVTYRKLIAKSLVLGEILTQETAEKTVVGLMIPNSKEAVMAFYGLQSKHRVAAMINYSAGPINILSACQTANIKYLWTSKVFVQEAKLAKTIDLLRENKIKVKFLENCKTSKNRYWGLYCLSILFPKWMYQRQCKWSSDNWATMPSTILFTSGSSGKPKGVVLSHKNIIYNYLQVNTMIDASIKDKVLAVMPIFHAFGLIGGVINPIFTGSKVFTYPTPLHYKTIPEIIYQEQITVLFGTNTFLQGYSKYGNPYDFRSLRYLFAGGEKVQESTRFIYADKFGIRVLEGYGTTEASPIISINTPMYNKTGTVGRLLPGIQYQLKNLPDFQEGQELWIKGDNVMLGYMSYNHPGIIDYLKEGWLNTGDVVIIDHEGFITIIGRTKRFAKIGGEMIGLDAIEEITNTLWPKYKHACISKPHPQKGEFLILVTENNDADLNELRQFAKIQGFNPLYIPKIIKVMTKIPLLGSGKPNYVELENEFDL